MVIRVACAVALAFTALGGATPARAGYSTDPRPEADWILSLQVTGGPHDGLIAANLPAERCIPYFSNMAASGLAAAAYATGDMRYAEGAWRWLAWYAAHMDASGFVTDYEFLDPTPADGIDDRQWTSTGTYDSTDSYAATFISAVRDIWVATGDANRVAALWPAIRKAVAAVQATAAPDWLTYAKPGNTLKYLMDNVEVYDGWRALQTLAAEAVDDAPLRATAAQWLTNMPAALGSFWNESQGGYDIAISDLGGHDLIDWSEFYPSATAQIWMINSGLVTPPRASALLDTIELTHPSWDQPFAQDIFDSDKGHRLEPVKWWPEFADAFARSGRTSRAEIGLSGMVSAALQSNRAWPYHSGNAGRIVALTVADPVTSLLSGPAPFSASQLAPFAFTGRAGPSQGSVTFECSLDQGLFTACTSPAEYGGLAQGPHRFQVRARDGLGRIDASPATHTWTVDLTAPVATVTTGPADGTAPPAMLTFTATDNVTAAPSLECSLDGAAFAGCTSPTTYGSLTTGTHSFAVRARDQAGNVGAVALHSWFADGVAPDTEITSGPPPLIESGQVVIEFRGADDITAAPTFECKLGSAPFAACTSPAGYSTAQEGAFVFQVRARDAAGNVDQTPAARSWIVDHSPPSTVIVGGPPSATNARHATIVFAGSDGAVPSNSLLYECSLDGAPFARCTSPRRLSGLLDGPHWFEVRAVDSSGRVDPTPARRSWLTDTIAPQTRILTDDGAVMADAPPFLSRFIEGSAFDERSGVERVDVTFTPPPAAGKQITLPAEITCDAPRTTCSWRIATALPSGRYRVSAAAWDRAGNADQPGPSPINIVVI